LVVIYTKIAKKSQINSFEALFKEFYNSIIVKYKPGSGKSVRFVYQMKAIRSISAVLLAILVLVSSSSFMVGMHFCMGEVQNIALLGKAESCQKEKALPACHKHLKPACCEDELVYHESADFKGSIEHIHTVAPAPMDVEQPAVLISEVIPASRIARLQYYNYDPPLRSCDLTVEQQVFLI